MQKGIGLVLALFIFLCSCRDNRLDVDVSGIKAEVRISRFERELFGINPSALQPAVQELKKKYGTFFNIYNSRIAGLGDENSPGYYPNLRNFITEPHIRDVYKEIEKQYPDVTEIEAGLSGAFKHYKYYFPDRIVPRVVTYAAPFSYALFMLDSMMGIGLDFYLGKDCRFYPMTGFPQYLIRKMDRKYLLADCMKGWAQTEFVPDPNRREFLYQMIYNGKMLYFLDAMFPDTPDSLKIGYMSGQLEWCEKNEGHIWRLFVEKQLLFKTGEAEYKKYINDGPGTNGFPKEAPAMIGCWTGWQIVRAYMARNPHVTLKQLMYDHDAQKILAQSKYKPKP